MAQHEVQFTRDPAENSLIQKIAKRAAKQRGADVLSTAMDISATHENGNPLRLADLLAADDLNFYHDVFGIARHLDRRTGMLTGHFSPRFSQREVCA